MPKRSRAGQNQHRQSSASSTPRRALQELSPNVCQSSSPDLPRNLNFISFEDDPDSCMTLGLDISFMSDGVHDGENQGEDCSCEYSSALEHSEYRRLANEEGRDSRVFDDEYIIPPYLTDDYTGAPVQLYQHKLKDHVGPWVMGKTLGTGATGRVRLCRNQFDNRLGAVKIMSKQRVDETEALDESEKPKQKWTNSMEREVIIMKMVRHPNVVRMHDVWEGRHELYLVLEYVDGGDLFDYMIQQGSLCEPEAMRIFIQILKGVEYCHHFNICHRDLKLENILLDKSGQIKVADFGFAALQPPGWRLARSCGTPHYAAPEVIAGGEYNGPPADIWSCGIILYALLNGAVPFDDEDQMMILMKVRIGKYKMPTHMSPEAQDLVYRILNVNPEERITMKEIWKHPLVTLYLDEEDYAARKRQASYKTVARPVECAEEIDRTILESMGNLWPCAKDLEVIKAALLNPEPNQEKVFYALLERYKDDNSEYFSGRFAATSKALKRLSGKSGKLLRCKTSSTRSGAQSRAANKRAEKVKYISQQRLKLIQESEESLATCANTDERGNSEDADDAWQDDDFAIRDSSGINTEDHHLFNDDNYVSSGGTLHFEVSQPEYELPSSPVEEPSPQEIQVNTQRRKARPKSWVSVASHRRSVIFNHQISSKANRLDVVDLNDSLQVHQDEVSIRPPTPDSSSERIVMGRKEGVKARRNKRASYGSSYSGAVIGIAAVVPVRRRAMMQSQDRDIRRRSMLPGEEDDVRKVSREFSDICEAAFRTTAAVQPILPHKLPSSAVLNHTVMDLELSQLTLAPDVNTMPMAPKNLRRNDKRSAIHVGADYHLDLPVRTLQKDSELDAVIADLDKQIKRHGNEAVNGPRLVKGKRRAVSGTMQRALREREERRTTSEPTRPSQGQNNRHHTVTQHHQFENDARILNIRNVSTRTETGALDQQHNSTRERPLGRMANARGGYPESAYSDIDRDSNGSSRSNSAYVERHRREVTRLDPGYSPKKENYNENIDANDINIQKKRTLFSKLLNTKFGTARATGPQSSKEKTSGFWSTIGSKIVSTASKTAQESRSVGANKFFRLWKHEHRKERNYARPVPPVLICQISDEDDASLENVQYVKPEWFKRALNIKPASHILCFKACALITHRKVLDILEEWHWKELGVVDIKANKHQGLIMARVSKRNAINIRPVSFVIQVRAYGPSTMTGKSVVRILQQKGAASSLRRLVHEITKVCRSGGILIEDAMEIAHMERSFDAPKA